MQLHPVMAEDLCMPYNGCSFLWEQQLRSAVQNHEDVACNKGLFGWFDCGSDFTDLHMGPVQQL